MLSLLSLPLICSISMVAFSNSLDTMMIAWFRLTRGVMFVLGQEGKLLRLVAVRVSPSGFGPTLLGCWPC